MPSRPPPIPGRQRAAGSCGHRSPRRRSQPSRPRWSARPSVALLDQEGAASSGVRMREEPAGLGPRDGRGAVEPEFVAAAADGDALGRSTPATPPVTHNLTHTLFSMPADATGRRRLSLDWTGEPTGLAVAARRRYQVPDERESRNTAGPPWTPAAPAGPTLPNSCGGELAVHKKTGERTPEVPLAWRSPGTSQEYLAPTAEPSGTLNNARGNPAPSRRIPSAPLLPPRALRNDGLA